MRQADSTCVSRPVDRFGLAALVASGTLGAHQLGYLVDGEARAAHSYFAFVGPLVVLGALVAAWTAAVRILRRDGGTPPSLVVLTALQLGLYVTMETAERAAGIEGLGSGWSAPVLLGLVAQPLVAWTALRLLRASTRLLRRFAEPPPVEHRRPVRSWSPPADLRLLSVQGGAIRLRGPPVGRRSR